ncbi:MAG: hypothetical protein M1131_04145 [Actinobacteria bacterium]|nr:hypothetical protein [Actinomycetota bacterium]MCL6095374.1 hypothetical protein [Actinomycetota bacterium]
MRGACIRSEQVIQITLFDEDYLNSMSRKRDKPWFLDEHTRSIGKKGVAEARRVLHTVSTQTSTTPAAIPMAG